MKIKMYFVNIVVKALLVELLCLMIIDANGTFIIFLLSLHALNFFLLLFSYNQFLFFLLSL